MSFRERWRAATAETHTQVDRRFSRCDLGRADEHRSFLHAHLTVLPGCESALEASDAGRSLADWSSRVRTPALVADLDQIGGAPAPGTLAMPPLSSAAAFGMLRVLEGPRLGGSVPARRVLANPDARCREATRYLRHGEGSRFWPVFLDAMEASPDIRADQGAAVTSAIATFALFRSAAGAMPTGHDR